MVTVTTPAQSAMNTSASPSTGDMAKRQKGAIDDAASRHPMKEGDTWYIIPAQWYSDWKDYVDGKQDAPGPIDTSSLFDDNGELRMPMSEGQDYDLVNQQQWQLLTDWYKQTGPVAKRKVILQSYNEQAIVEVYPMRFTVKNQLTTSPDHITFTCSRTKSCVDLCTEIAARFNQASSAVHIWVYSDGVKEELLNDNTKPLGEVLLTDSENLLLIAPSAASKPDSSPTPVVQKVTVTPPGLTGLMNLGNTCFMNSSLQCLSNVPPLTEYITSGAWKGEINSDNPIGTGGALAGEFARLIDQLWTGEHRSVAPRNFKMTLARFAPMFSGYQQQDSQELLAFLLDGLHEDLNRVLKKPYVEVPDADDRPDHIQAEEAWQRYRMRDDSVIVDNFQGQYKSTLVCPECDKVSITFDPFMYLTLPFPPKERVYNVTFWGKRDPAPVTVRVTICKDSVKISSLVDAVSEVTGVPTNKLFFGEVFHNSMYTSYHRSQPISEIGASDDVAAYEVDDVEVYRLERGSQYSMLRIKDDFVPLDDKDSILVHLKFVEPPSASTSRYSSSSRGFGRPRVMNVPRKPTGRQLYDLVADLLQVSPQTRVGTSATPSGSEEDAVMVPRPSTGTANTATNGTAAMDVDTEMEDESVTATTENTQDTDTVASTVTASTSADDDDDKDGVKPEPPVSPYPFRLTLCDSRGYSLYTSTSYHNDIAYDDAEVSIKLFGHLAVAIEDSGLQTSLEAASVSIAPHPGQREGESTPGSGQKKEKLSLEACLRRFMIPERLGEDDMWYCPQCKEHRQATKQMEVFKFPKVIVFNLKRFKYERMFRNKIDTLVDFPLNDLDLSEFLKHPLGPEDPSPIYDCVAVSNHFGGLGGGHYTAYAKNKLDGKWYNFDDSHVSKADENEIVSRSAYCLFYVRKDVSA